MYYNNSYNNGYTSRKWVVRNPQWVVGNLLPYNVLMGSPQIWVTRLRVLYCMNKYTPKFLVFLSQQKGHHRQIILTISCFFSLFTFLAPFTWYISLILGRFIFASWFQKILGFIFLTQGMGWKNFYFKTPQKWKFLSFFRNLSLETMRHTRVPAYQHWETHS